MLNPLTLSIMKELQEKVESLLHYSDSHSPYSVSAIGKSQNFIEVIKDETDNRPVQEFTAELFFGNLIRMHSWITEEEKNRIYRYRELENYCRLKFQEIKIIKIGELYKDVHLIGKTEQGDFVILSTYELHLPMHTAFD